MKYLTVLMIIPALLFVLFSEGFAMHHGKSVTPYGDSCARCGHYGTCKSTISAEDAEKAITDYYHKKGFKIEIENRRGRFIKAKVKDKDRVIDVIIFDRRTGRIRSTY